ncbi:Maf family protein [Alteromonas sp. ASW11-36]|uniref:dTTP/UTP pyrophosphatase n=1 Tax=Alteromonas arenosi TaxID=3055817 RepID=A0ABT7SSK2_9ALTE|nr:Maf family protein [Alteromonas sp. ASW11-36]MDM7859130.1 Maf family protein [Alteromonas sp. ASW11-36]
MSELILASQSPRRAELLSTMGYRFTVITADIDESPLPDELPEHLVLRLASSKADAVWQTSLPSITTDTAVLAADTIVVANQTILGKPKHFADFTRMMRLLSGSTHTVMTAIACRNSAMSEAQVVTADVQFCTLTERDIARYWDTGEPKDKAGGYGIQARGGQFVQQVHGSYSAIVGLPMVETKLMLQKFGVYA